MLSRLRRYLQANGLRQTVVAVPKRLWRLVYSSERLIVLVKQLDEIVVPAKEGELRVEALSREHLGALSQLNRARGRPEVDRRFARYVEQGFQGFVGYLGEQLVGYYWWVDRDVPTPYPDLRKLGLGIELGQGDVYGSDFFLLAAHRGGGLAADFLFKIERGLRELGYERLWGYVVSDNRPARWIYSTRGYVPMWIVNRTKILILMRSTREPS